MTRACLLIIASIMTRHPKSIKASDSSCNIARIPDDVLLYQVLGRIAASSSTDLFNLRSSCKLFDEMSEDKHVYQTVLLDKFPIVPWNPLSQKQKDFFSKCQESENSEAIYRQAVLEYFNEVNLGSAFMHLIKAMELGHIGAFYVTCIVLLVSGDHEYKGHGVEHLRDFKSKYTIKELSMCRDNLIKMLRQIWVKNPSLKEPTLCCSDPDQHPWRNGWSEDDEINDCEACNADREIKSICSTYNYH